MTLAGVLVDGREYGWDEVWDYQELGGFPQPILRAIKNNADQEHDLISASQITGCLRAAWLKHTVDYYEEAGKRLPLIMGTFAHALFENSAPQNALTEVALKWTTSDGVKVTGHADLVYPEEGVLADFKTVRWLNPSCLPYGSHGAQVNIYRWMLEHNEAGPAVKVSKLQIIYVDLTGPDIKYYRHNGVVVVDIPVWSDERVKNFITERAAVLNTAQERGILPPMVEKTGRWACAYCSPRIKAKCEEGGE